MSSRPARGGRRPDRRRGAGVKAVNLIPSDARARGRASAAGLASARRYAGPRRCSRSRSLFVTVYVLTEQHDLRSQGEAGHASGAGGRRQQAEAARLAQYTKFAQLAQARARPSVTIAAARFDWHAALSDLSKVVPANTSLQSLTGTRRAGRDGHGRGAAAGAAAARCGSDISVAGVRADRAAPRPRTTWRG